jgi:hypothetical protein
METRTVLEELLAENRAYSDTYHGGLANHASMALTSLAHLGATPERLRAYWEHERSLLEPLDPDGAECAIRRRYETAIRASGRAAVLRAELPRLLPGVGAAAFHGLLRTAYALDATDDAELAAGLAHWERAFMPLGTPIAATVMRTVGEAYDVARPTIGGRRPSGDLIADRMVIMAGRPGFATAAASSWYPAAFDDLAHRTTAIFAATGDFTALHAMTGTFAMRAMLPYVDDEAAFRSLWHALVAAYATVGMPIRPTPADEAAMLVDAAPWETIVAAGITSDDDHVIKVVDVCVAEFARSGDPIAAAAASRRLRSVGALR